MATTGSEILFGTKPSIAASATAVAETRAREVEAIREYLIELIKASLPFDKQGAVIDKVNSNLNSYASMGMNLAALKANLLTIVQRQISVAAAEEAQIILEKLVVLDNDAFVGVTLSANAMQRVHARCQAITPKSVDAYVESLRNPAFSPLAQKKIHEAQVTMLTETEHGKKLAARHNAALLKDPVAVQQAELTLEKARAATDALLKKYPSGALHEQLEIIKLNDLIRDQEVRQLVAQMHQGKTVALSNLKAAVLHGVAVDTEYHLAHYHDEKMATSNIKALNDVYGKISPDRHKEILNDLALHPEKFKKACSDINGVCAGKVIPAQDMEYASVASGVQSSMPALNLEAAWQVMQGQRRGVDVQVNSARRLTENDVHTNLELARITKSEGFSSATKQERISDIEKLIWKSEEYKHLERTQDNVKQVKEVATTIIARMDSGDKNFQMEKIDLKKTLRSGLASVLKGDAAGVEQYGVMVENAMKKMGASVDAAEDMRSLLVGVGVYSINARNFLLEHNMPGTAKFVEGAVNIVGNVGVEFVVKGEKFRHIDNAISDAKNSLKKGYNDLKVSYNKEDDIEKHLKNGKVHSGWVPIIDKNKDGKLNYDEISKYLVKSGVKLEDYDKADASGKAGADGHISAAELGKALLAAQKVERDKVAKAKAEEEASKQRKARIDVNKDGKISGDEFMADMNNIMGIKPLHVKDGQHVTPDKTPHVAANKTLHKSK